MAIPLVIQAKGEQAMASTARSEPTAHDRNAEGRLGEDGRTVRRDRNIDRVIDAALALFAESRGVPGIDDIAARAGLSSRSLYRYFEDAASLYFEVARRKLDEIEERARAITELPAPLRDRAVMLADWRWPMHDQLRGIGDAIRPYQDTNPAIGKLRRAGSSFIERHVEHFFRPELDELGTHRPAVLSTLRILWSVETWSVLGFDMGHDRDLMSKVVIEATIRLLRP